MSSGTRHEAGPGQSSGPIFPHLADGHCKHAHFTAEETEAHKEPLGKGQTLGLSQVRLSTKPSTLYLSTEGGAWGEGLPWGKKTPEQNHAGRKWAILGKGIPWEQGLEKRKEEPGEQGA